MIDIKSCKSHPDCELPVQVVALADAWRKERSSADVERLKYREVQKCIHETTKRLDDRVNKVYQALFGDKALNYDGIIKASIKSEERIIKALDDLVEKINEDKKEIKAQLKYGNKLLMLNRAFIFVWATIRKPIILIILGLCIAIALGIPAIDFIKSVIMKYN